MRARTPRGRGVAFPALAFPALAFPAPAFLVLAATGCVSNVDLDADGWSTLDGDCDDLNATTHPGATDDYGDSIDDDCDGGDGTDADGDGVPDGGGGDCDDGDAAVHPDADEIWNGIDDDCDGTVDTSIGLEGWGVPVVADEGGPVADLWPGGDLDGDGIDEVLVRADTDDNRSTVLVLPGETPWAQHATAWDTVGTSRASAQILPEDDWTDGSWSVCAPGDLTGDGIADLAVGRPNADPQGGAWIIAGPISGVHDVTDAVASVQGRGEALLAGWSIAGPGDVTGDGVADLLVGDPYDDTSDWEAGAAWIVPGGALDGDTALSSIGVSLRGESASDYSGGQVAGLGDIDGDGLGDILVGRPERWMSSGGSDDLYVVLGSEVLAAPDTMSLADADVRLTGAWLARRGGDLDGDGRDDVAVGEPFGTAWDPDRGGVFLFLGRERWPDQVDGATDADEILLGEDPWAAGSTGEDLAGWDIAGLGDVDEDGVGDLLVAAPEAETVYVVLGRPRWSGSSLLADIADGRIYAPGTGLGYQIRAAGDITGDGHADALLHGAASNGTDPRSWVLPWMGR